MGVVVPEDQIPETDKETVGIFEWFITIPFMLIPVFNILFASFLIWLDRTSKSKRNFYIAVIFAQIIWFFVNNLFLV